MFDSLDAANINVFQNEYKIITSETNNELVTILGSCVSMIGFKSGLEKNTNIAFMTHFHGFDFIEKTINDISQDLEKYNLGYKNFGSIILTGGHNINFTEGDKTNYKPIGTKNLEKVKKTISDYNNRNIGKDEISYIEFVSGKSHKGTKRKLDVANGILNRKFIGKPESYNTLYQNIAIKSLYDNLKSQSSYS